MTTRGIRGAINIPVDEKTELFSATQELLTAIISANPDLRTEDIASALFTVTDDITSAFPAQAARQMGWNQVPMMCTREIPVANSLPLCIRVLIHWNTMIQQSEIRHVYLGDSAKLRPDLTGQKI
jgi:chorismate mutase